MLNRKLLTDAGLDKETVDIVMSLRNDIFEGYVPQKDVDTMVGDAEQRGKASVVSMKIWSKKYHPSLSR